MKVYSMDSGEIETLLDSVKAVILATLVIEGRVASAVADDWCKNHTLAVHDKASLSMISKLGRCVAEAPKFSVFLEKA